MGCGEQASLLVMSLGKALNGKPSPIYVEDRWPSFSSEERVDGSKGIRLYKQKILGNADYCCSDPKTGIKPPTTPYLSGNKARKEKKSVSF